VDRELLKGYLDRGLSLIEIGAAMNRDPSTVGYWVEKHGLEANGKQKYAPRGGLSREELQPLVEGGSTLKEIASVLDRSPSTVSHWLKVHGLKLRGARRNTALFREAASQGLTSVVADCRSHGQTDFIRRPDGGWRCKKCRSQQVSDWRRRGKDKLVAMRGGGCQICGYHRYQGALQFHHLEPGEKRFPISRAGRSRNFAELLDESKKTVLLCANCHAEVEAGVTPLPPLTFDGAEPRPQREVAADDPG
jgi:DNA-binding transcriptional ArsR family regulator